MSDRYGPDEWEEYLDCCSETHTSPIPTDSLCDECVELDIERYGCGSRFYPHDSQRLSPCSRLQRLDIPHRRRRSLHRLSEPEPRSRYEEHWGERRRRRRGDAPYCHGDLGSQQTEWSPRSSEMIGMQLGEGPRSRRMLTWERGRDQRRDSEEWDAEEYHEVGPRFAPEYDMPRSYSRGRRRSIPSASQAGGWGRRRGSDHPYTVDDRYSSTSSYEPSSSRYLEYR
ncbi:hypothetical protein V2A60_004403 [Cordyceps javanica]